jgi:drug/metabolite transporter (DMT)-like permease
MANRSSSPDSRLARFFELRAVVAVLFAVYGVVCTIWGLAFTTQREIERAGGFNLNLTSGIGMLVIAIGFGLWAALRPLGAAQGGDEPRD